MDILHTWHQRHDSRYTKHYLVDGAGAAVDASEFPGWILKHRGHERKLLSRLTIQLAKFLLRIVEHVLGTRFLARLPQQHSRPSLFKVWGSLLQHDVITSVLQLPQYTGYPSNFCYSLPLSRVKGRTDGHTIFLIANVGGTDFHQQHVALERAFAEAIERFAYLIYHEHELIFKRVAELSSRVLDPVECVVTRRSTEARHEHRHTWLREQPFGWVKGRSYPDNEDILIPAQLVFWNYHRRIGEPFLRESNTSGAAAHRTQDQAIHTGILELIERDTLMNTWFAAASPQQISIGSLPSEVRYAAAIDAFNRSPLQLYLLLLPTDMCVPVIGAALIDPRGDGPVISLGSSASLDLGAAIVKAVQEAFTVYIVERERKVRKASVATQYPTDALSPTELQLLTFGGRMELWWHQSAISWLSSLLHGGVLSYEEAQNRFSFREVGALITQLQRFGYRILYHEIDTPWMRALEYQVVKVVIPELQPLYLDERRWGYNRQRLNEWCSRLQIPRPKEVNTNPHPFP